MSTTTLRPSVRTLTELDHIRILNLVRRNLQADLIDSDASIESVIDDADLVPSREVPADVVTMYSQIVVADAQLGARRRLTLCYPQDAEPSAGFISVLSPIGASLLGLEVGQTAQWVTPDGRRASATVKEILFQPEANGDYLL